MSQRRELILRNGVLAVCTLFALILLASFYSIVSGAVDRAARHRLASSDGAMVSSANGAGREPARRVELMARSND